VCDRGNSSKHQIISVNFSSGFIFVCRVMEIEEERIYTLEEVVKILGVSKSTLRSWDRDGYLVAGRTKGRHRRYSGAQVQEIQKRMFGESK